MCLRPQKHSWRAELTVEVSNPSRGTCAFGLKLEVPAAVAEFGLKPLSGNVCLRPNMFGFMVSPWGPSQTPLGERVPSAEAIRRRRRLEAACLKPLSGNVCLRPSLATSLRMTSAGSLKPLSGNVCLRPSCHDRSSQNVELSLKPLSGNVCLRPRQGTAKRNRLPVCLKPLSGNVCLRPWDTFNGLLCLPCVSNPSRGTCAFGPQWRKSILGSLSWSQTPLGERVPSALERDDFRREVIEGLKPLSGNVCLRPTLGRGRLRNRASVSNPSRGTCAFGPLSRRRLGFSGAASQTPLGERVPSAGERDPWRSVRGVSNPSRGTCAFGRA